MIGNEKEFEKVIKIMKFGGSCLKNPQSFKQIVNILNKYKKNHLIITVSALYGVTDLLVRITHLASEGRSSDAINLVQDIEEKHQDLINLLFCDNQIKLKETQANLKGYVQNLLSVLGEVEEFGIVPYFIDYIMSFGEKMSTNLLQLYLKKEDFDSKFFIGEELIITNSEFNNALPDINFTARRIEKKLIPLLKNGNKNQVICVTGFIGRNTIGYTTTLGRGGSDFTASIIARSIYDLNPKRRITIILWKDVDGILSGNPKYLKTPNLVSTLNFEEAKEISFLGVKILHPKCTALIEKKKIQMEIRNFNKPLQTSYTLISNSSKDEKKIKGISILDNKVLVSIDLASLISQPDIIGNIFTLFAKKKIIFSMINQTTSRISLSFIINENNKEKAHKILTEHPSLPKQWIHISFKKGGIVSIIGNKIQNNEFLIKLGNAMKLIKVTPLNLTQSANGLNFSFCVERKSILNVANAINTKFFN